MKLSLFTDKIIQYIVNSKGSTKKLLELINEFSYVAGHKINIKKFVASLYTNMRNLKNKPKSHLQLQKQTKNKIK